MPTPSMRKGIGDALAHWDTLETLGISQAPETVVSRRELSG
jgi:hypothetical protein